MGLFDFFKKKKDKKKPVKKEKKIKEVKKAPKVKVEPKPKPKPKPKKKVKPKKNIEIIYKSLKGPHITEKATDLAKQNQYVFKVFPRTNKIEIKKAIESLYGVDVISVNIINIPRKQKRLGKIKGFKPGFKKAIIKIKQGQKIETLPT